MGGKGRQRREKNYRAAHGGYSRLPPPPVPSSVDAVPSKLRQLMAFTHPFPSGSAKGSADTAQGNRGKGGRSNGIDKKLCAKDEFDSKTFGIKREGNKGNSTRQHMDHDDDIEQNSEKKRKKRKRKRVDDLRFETTEELGVLGSKRRERKKKHLEARKNKHKKVKVEEHLDFPGCEEIKFGEVVQAPPKLVSIPKALKSAQDASQERLRLQAVEAYRKRRGWTSRPGIHVRPPLITSPLL